MRKIKEFLPSVNPYYYITKSGEVISRTRKNEIKLKPNKTTNGYLKVVLMGSDGSRITVNVHRLVAMAFLENSNEGYVVNHKDGNKENNSVENLEWVSPKENIVHSWQNGLANTKSIEREKSNLASITEEQAMKVVELLSTNLYTDKEISCMTGLSIKGIISKIRRKETWKHLTINCGTLGKTRNK